MNRTGILVDLSHVGVATKDAICSGAGVAVTRQSDSLFAPNYRRTATY
jgi:hypothetical protein